MTMIYELKKKHQKLYVLLLRWHDNINDFNPKT